MCIVTILDMAVLASRDLSSSHVELELRSNAYHIQCILICRHTKVRDRQVVEQGRRTIGLVLKVAALCTPSWWPNVGISGPVEACSSHVVWCTTDERSFGVRRVSPVSSSHSLPRRGAAYKSFTNRSSPKNSINTCSKEAKTW